MITAAVVGVSWAPGAVVGTCVPAVGLRMSVAGGRGRRCKYAARVDARSAPAPTHTDRYSRGLAAAMCDALLIKTIILNLWRCSDGWRACRVTVTAACCATVRP